MFNVSHIFGLILPIVVAATINNTSEVNSSTYKNIPPLYAADDYRKCFSEQKTQQPQLSPPSYCMVYAEVQPDNNSVVWQKMMKIHKSYFIHYRHDLLYRGICTSKCARYSESLNSSSVDETYSDNMLMIKKIFQISQNQNSIKGKEQEMHACVNDEMQKKYKVGVKTLVTYCDDPNEPIEKGYPFLLAIVILSVIVFLNIISTIYDFYLKKQLPSKEVGPDYFDINHKIEVDKYLTIFSMYRNYRRLVVPNLSAIGKDMRFVDGFRTILSMIIIYEHMGMTQFEHLKNPEFFEKFFANQIILMLVHMWAVIELFFLLSGLMLFIKFDRSKYVSSQSSLMDCIHVYVRMLFSRYLRYMPSVLLLILFSSQILIHLQHAPFWRFVLETNVVKCRNDWLTNVLMVSNFKPNNTCWAHTWYISADFQLYAFFLAILILVAKYPKSKKLIYILVGGLGLVLPSIFSAVMKLKSLSILYTEKFRHHYLKDVDALEQLYFSPFTNLNGFFIGLMCGELYIRYLRHDKYKQTIGRYLKYSPFLGILAIFGICYWGSLLFPRKDYSLWNALFELVYKNVGITIVATFVVVFKMCHTGGFLSKPFFRPLARISYQVYLWHFIIIYIILGNYQQPFEIHLPFLLIFFTSTWLLSLGISFIVAIMVEYPISELLNVFNLKVKK